MRTDRRNELIVQFLSFKVSAKGVLAIYVVAVPLAILLFALALRIAGKTF